MTVFLDIILQYILFYILIFPISFVSNQEVGFVCSNGKNICENDGLCLVVMEKYVVCNCLAGYKGFSFFIRI